MITVEFKKQVVEFLSAELDYEFEYIQPYHIRLTHPDKRRLDYFPKSGRATWVGSQKWFVIKDIEQYILNHFK
jgi:hypothetical protein